MLGVDLFSKSFREGWTSALKISGERKPPSSTGKHRLVQIKKSSQFNAYKGWIFHSIVPLWPTLRTHDHVFHKMSLSNVNRNAKVPIVHCNLFLYACQLAFYIFSSPQLHCFVVPLSGVASIRIRGDNEENRPKFCKKTTTKRNIMKHNITAADSPMKTNLKQSEPKLIFFKEIKSTQNKRCTFYLKNWDRK